MLRSKIFLFLFISFFSQVSQKAFAQVIPDNTLGSESSVINSITELRSRIEGGARRGSNLFHSFENFSIDEGLKVYFANPEGIANIFSRVTGNNISEILGTLGVEGTANLFFMNPNGIIFGENAFVDAGGSFIATTANSIDFSDGTSFDSKGGNQKPLLTWNAPIGLGLDGNNGSITIRGDGHNLLLTPEKLFVSDNNLPSARTEISIGEGFALIGNGIEFSGGVLDISAEKIELGSIAQGQVKFSLSPQLEFDYSQVEKFADINLDYFSLIDIDGNEAIKANFEGNSIFITNGSFILLRETPDVSLDLPREININAQEKISIIGVTSDTPPSPEGLTRGITAIAAENFTGEGIDINITSKDLILSSGGAIGSNAFQESLKSGKIDINTTNTVRLSGFIPSNPALANTNIASSSLGTAESNSITVHTRNLDINNGATILATTLGSGKSGDIKIEAQDSIIVDGVSNNSSLMFPSALSTNSLGSGIAGTINVETTDLSILNGGAISTASFSEAATGNININATNSIVIDGFSEREFIEATKDYSTITSLVSRINPELIDENPGLPTNPMPNRDAGNISLNTNKLIISNQANITVENDGTGDAGNLEIKANSINLDNFGSITAAAASGAGGNISITSSDLNISNDSQITAIAGGVLPGGNITIKTIDLTANNNNQITASAAQGEGGNIIINAQDSLTLNNQNSIAAASASGNGGNVELTTDQLQIRDNSNISTSAQGLGNGGNITIKADSVLAIDDSDIIATAEQGNGGNIIIEADGVLGIEERPAEPNNGTSDADASSEFGQDGTVEITNPISDQYDPIIAMKEPNTKAIGEGLRSQCWAEDFDRRSLSLVVVGGGGFPSSPYDFQDEVEYAPDPDFVPPPEEEKEDWVIPPAWQPGDPIINSNAIRVTEDGQIYAVAVLTPQKAEELLCGNEKVEEEEEK